MTPETKKRYTPIPNGAFEKISLHLKNVFTKEITDVSNNPDFWIEIEDKAEDCKLSDKRIAMEYYLRGVNHLKLSEMIVNGFSGYRSSSADDNYKRQVIINLSWDILKLYPKKYIEKFENKSKRKITMDDGNMDIPF